MFLCVYKYTFVYTYMPLFKELFLFLHCLFTYLMILIWLNKNHDAGLYKYGSKKQNTC